METAHGGGGEFLFGFHRVSWRFLGQAEERAEEITPKGTGFVRDGHHFSKNLSWGFGDADVIVERFAHLLFSVCSGE